jgi:hypothetical protein
VSAIVEALFMVAFPGDAPHPAATANVKSPGFVEIELNGDETPLFRVMALALLATTIGDEIGPEMSPTGRYAFGKFQGVEFLITTPVTPKQQLELVAQAARIVDGVE